MPKKVSSQGLFTPAEILEQVPVVIWTTDAEGKCNWANSAFKEFSGLTLEQVRKENWTSLVHPDDLANNRKAYQEALERREGFQMEMRLRRKDGEYRWFLSLGSPRRQKGRFVGYVGGLFDIHEKYLSRAAGQKTEQMLRRFFDDASLGMAQIDIDGRYLHVNARLAMMVGYQVEELQGRNFQDITHPDDRARGAKAWSELFLQKRPYWEDQKRYIHKHGHEVQVLIRVSPIRNWNGDVVAMGSQVIDITDRVALEDALRKSNTRFELALSARKMGVWSVDCVTGKTTWDDTLYDLYGVTKQEMTHKISGWMELVHLDDRERCTREIETAKMGTATAYELTYRILRGREIRHMRSSAMMERDSSNKVVRIVGLNWDVTEEVEHAQAMDVQRSISANVAKMAALGEMAAGMAHEINNPLAIIMGKVQQIKDMFKNGEIDRVEAMDHCEKLQSTVNRIAVIIRGLRSFARDDRRDPMMPIVIENIVRETLSFCQARFANQGVELLVTEPFPNGKIECHPGQISQILLNLLNNAFDAVVDAPKKQIQLDVVLEKDELIFRVTDWGPGVPATAAQKLFQPFFTTKPAGKGTGLGLSISKGIAENHGGKIQLISAHAPTIFEVRLPHRRARENAA